MTLTWPFNLIATVSIVWEHSDKMMPTSLNSPKMTRSLQQISDKFGGSLPSVNKLPMPKNLHLQDKLHTVQVKVRCPDPVHVSIWGMFNMVEYDGWNLCVSWSIIGYVLHTPTHDEEQTVCVFCVGDICDLAHDSSGGESWRGSGSEIMFCMLWLTTWARVVSSHSEQRTPVEN